MITTKFPRLFWLSHFTFFCALLFQVVLYYLAPFTTKNPVLPVWIELFLFQLLFFGASALAFYRLNSSNQTHHRRLVADIFDSKKILLVLLIISLVGLGLHTYSKYYLTHIRPIGCVFEIRFAWLEVARDRLPTLVRIASMLGHLLTSFSYIGLFMACALCTQSDGLTRKSYAYLFYITAFIVVGCIYAGFIASRNVSLAYLILAFAGAILGFSEETQSYRNGLRMGTLSLIIPLVFTLSFSSAVFNDRIYCAPPSSSGNTTEQHLASDYFLANCKDFSIECFSPEQAPNSFLKNLWSNCRTCPSTMLYLNHGIINFSQIISSKTRGDTVLFTLLNTIARRTGLEPNDEKVSSQRIYGPGGTTLADAAHHDYGWPGVMVAATLLGVIWGTGIAMISRGRLLRSLGLCTYVITFYILAVSTIFVGTNILPFPFVAFSSTLTFAWLALRRKEAKQNQE